MTTENQITSTSGSESCNAIQGVKFNKHHVAFEGKKARVWYSLDNRLDGKKCVTIYAKDYSHTLRDIFKDLYENKTDTMTDYFDQGSVRLFEEHPNYSAARIRAVAI